jgi:F0F1-type ATP synthase assembly protein I
VPEKPRSPSNWSQLSGIGFEVAALVGGCAFAGYWFDRHFKSAPWGLLVGCLLGLVSGMYQLIRESLAANRDVNAIGHPGQSGRASSKAPSENDPRPPGS